MNVGVSHACCASNRGDSALVTAIIFKRDPYVCARTNTIEQILCHIYADEYRSAADTRRGATVVDVYDAFCDVCSPTGRISPYGRFRFDSICFRATRVVWIVYRTRTRPSA